MNTDSVEFLSPKEVSLHLDAELFQASGRPNVPTTPREASEFACFLDLTKGEAVLCLSALDPQVREQSGQSGCCFEVGLPPVPQRLTSFGIGVGDPDVAAERLSKEFERSTFDLPDVDTLAVGRLLGVLADPYGVGVALDTDRPVRIEDAGEVCKGFSVHALTLLSGGEVTRGGDALWPRSSSAIPM